MKQGWTEKTLGEICNIIGGGTPSKSNNSFYEGNIPWATVRDMKTDYISKTEFYITDEAVKKCSTNIIPSGNVIIATRVGLGKICMIYRDTAINQDLRGILPKDKSKVDNKFLFWWFKSIAHLIESEGTGATVKGVKLPFIKSLKIPLPPLSEQQRMVEKLDRAFEEIDHAIAATEKNLENARELFDSYLNNIFTQKGDDWVERTFDDIANIKGGKRVPKGYKLLQEKTKHPYITVANFTDDGSVDTDKIQYIDDAVFSIISKYIISENDLFISIAGTIGKTGIVPDSLDGANLTENACKLVFKDNIFNKYVYYFTRTDSFITQASKHTRVATQPKLALIRLKNIKLPMPSIEIQRATVRNCDNMFHKYKKLESIYQRKLTALKELKQSLLKKAFEGEL